MSWFQYLALSWFQYLALSWLQCSSFVLVTMLQCCPGYNAPALSWLQCSSVVLVTMLQRCPGYNAPVLSWLQCSSVVLVTMLQRCNRDYGAFGSSNVTLSFPIQLYNTHELNIPGEKPKSFHLNRNTKKTSL